MELVNIQGKGFFIYLVLKTQGQGASPHFSRLNCIKRSKVNNLLILTCGYSSPVAGL